MNQTESGFNGVAFNDTLVKHVWRMALLFVLCIPAGPSVAVDYAGSKKMSWLENDKVYGNIHYQVGSLVGEPVVNVQLDWRPMRVRDHVPAIYARDANSLASDKLAFGTLGQKPDEGESQLRLYDAKVRLTIQHGRDTYFLDADAGVPGKPGSARSYNVPGIPDWGDMLRDSAGRPVSGAIVKDIMRTGLNVTDARLTSYKVDTSQYEQWWLEKNVDRYTKPLKDAIDRKLDALSDAFGLPVDDLRKEVAALRGTGKAGADIAKLQGILDKLSPSNLPKKYLGEGPERLVRLHRYSHLTQNADDILRRESDGLPPMPGSSRLYDNWHKQMEVRLAKNRLKLAQLEGKKHAIELAEQQAREAEQRARERREQIAREEREARERQVREAREKRERARQREARRRAREEQRQQMSQGDNFDFWGAVAEGLRSSGWQPNPYEPNWARDGWKYTPNTTSDSNSKKLPQCFMFKRPGCEWYEDSPKK